MTGHTNNPNGRKKGVPNKITMDLRQWINNFIDDNREQIKKDWKGLEPKDRILLFEKLLKYTLPTLQATTLNTGKVGKDLEDEIYVEKQLMIINGKEIEF